MVLNKKIFFLIIILFISKFYFSQPGPPSGPNCWPPPCIPVDGGISIFTLLSILFGYKFLLKKNK